MVLFCAKKVLSFEKKDRTLHSDLKSDNHNQSHYQYIYETFCKLFQ